MNVKPASYTFDDPALRRSPVSCEELAEIESSLLWSPADVQALRRISEIVSTRKDEILDVWYGFVGSNPHLVAAFAGPDGQPRPEYLAAVRERFKQWIDDLCTRDYDETWLAYQEEIGLRHHTSKKNQADQIESSSGHVPLRHLLALVVPITITMRDVLRAEGADDAAGDVLIDAWFKAVMLSVVLWARSYAPDLW